MKSPTVVIAEPTRAKAGEAAYSSERTNRYTQRLDAYLDALPGNAARLAFLSKELVTWTTLYEQFANLVDKGLAPEPDGPDVHDYLQTICAISTRRGRLAADVHNDTRDILLACSLIGAAVTAGAVLNLLAILGVLA